MYNVFALVTNQIIQAQFEGTACGVVSHWHFHQLHISNLKETGSKTI